MTKQAIIKRFASFTGWSIRPNENGKGVITKNQYGFETHFKSFAAAYKHNFLTKD